MTRDRNKLLDSYTRYNKSPKGRERRRTYNGSPKYLARKGAYAESPKGRETRRRYRNGKSKKD